MTSLRGSLETATFSAPESINPPGAPRWTSGLPRILRWRSARRLPTRLPPRCPAPAIERPSGLRSAWRALLACPRRNSCAALDARSSPPEHGRRRSIQYGSRAVARTIPDHTLARSGSSIRALSWAMTYVATGSAVKLVAHQRRSEGVLAGASGCVSSLDPVEGRETCFTLTRILTPHPLPCPPGMFSGTAGFPRECCRNSPPRKLSRSSRSRVKIAWRLSAATAW